ncbi:MAG: site-2 protease family protein [Chloroflexi bacterium]|nr:site-2 protease family protein [Chloroflexota bacterium]
MLDLLFSDPIAFLGLFPLILFTLGLALFVAITVHEFGHAYMAHRLGDDTAKQMGRLSLNPLVHLDPLGTAMLFLVGFGWGKPVPVNPFFLRQGARKGMALVAAAGPLANFATAAVLSAFVRAGLVPWRPDISFVPFPGLWELVGMIVVLSIIYNVILGIFNLIPLSPLDGFKLVLGIVPRDLAYSLSRVEQYGPMILITIVALDSFTGVGIFTGILRPVSDLIGVILVGKPLL